MSTVFTTAHGLGTPKSDLPSGAAPNDAIYRILVAVSSPNHALLFEWFDGVSWDTLLRHARHHSLIPLLAHRLLESQDGITIPAQIRARLRSDFQSNLLRNFGLLEETKQVVHAWRENGIEAIPYKGTVLAEQLWGSFALRECSDLDFLVRQIDVERAGQVLCDWGYQQVSPVAAYLRPALLRNASEEQFRHPASQVLLELQWAPAPRTLALSFDNEGLWNRITQISVAGETVNAPKPEDLVGMLCIHGWKHNWSKLIWVADLARTIRKYPLDWDEILSSAERWGWRRILLLGAELVRLVYKDITTKLDHHGDAGVQAVARRLEQNLRRGQPNSYLDWHRDMLVARDSINSQIHQAANFVFTPGLAEYSSSKLPKWASLGYRMVRLARVLSLWPRKTLA